MVNTPQKPVANLATIRSAVKNGSWTMTRKARNDAENLGHDSSSVRQIVLGLTDEEFDHVWIKKDDRARPVLDAHGNQIKMDVYSPKVSVLTGEFCTVYLKISVSSSGALFVTVASLHLPWK